MRKLYILILTLIIALGSEAQPTYWNAIPTGGGNVFPFGVNPGTGKKVQWIVAAGEFSQPAPLPAGNNITSIWIRTNSAGNATYTNLTVRMATVSTSTFFAVGAFYTGPMTTVRSQNTTIVSSGAGVWVEIPLTTTFTYDPTMNLVIEIYQCGYTGTGFSIRQQAFGVSPNRRRAYSDASSLCGVTPLPTSGDQNVAGIGLNVTPAVPCPTPTAQPTGLVLTPISQVQINGSFTAAVPPSSGYLVVRYPSAAVPVNPVNGTNYAIGQSLGTGTVISNTNATNFTTSGLTPGTTYDFYVYSFNSGACGTAYLTAAPLFGSAATLPCTGPPTLTCPSNITTNTASGQCGANVTYPPATAGGSPPPTVTYSQASGTFFPKGTTTVIATATNVCGTTTCTFTITVVDNQPPTITCPANVQINNTPGLCSGVATFPAPTALDNCPFPGTIPLSITQNTSQTVVAGSVACNAGGFHTNNSYWREYNLGPLALTGPFTVNSVTFGIELADANGTGTTQPITVRVHTSNQPFPTGYPGSLTQVASQTFNIPDQTLSLYTATFTTPPTVAANARLVLEVFSPDGRAPANNRFFIGSNALGQSAPCYLSAADCGAPNPVTIASLGFPNMHAIINAAGLVSNPSSSITQIAGLPSGSAFPVGVTTNTFRVTDGAGLTATCSMTVTVLDVQNPTITCPTSITQNTDVGTCVATVVTPNPVFADNCAVTVLTWTITGATTASSPLTGINFVGTRAFNLNGTTGSGVSTVTYIARDAAGNSATCSFTVTVIDAWIPVISGQPANQTVCVGSNAVFTVTASVPAGNPLTYQWQGFVGGVWVNIAGATASTLPLNAVTFSMNTNTYRCILTGRCSVVTSGAATLYVNQLPTISLVASGPLAMLPGQMLNISAVVSPGGGSYVWRKNGVVVAGATGSSLTGLTVSDIGSYTCTYTDLNGCVSTSAPMTITGLASDNLWIYPNPNSGNFHVRVFNQPNELITVRVFDTKGAMIYQQQTVTNIAYTDININLEGRYIIASANYIVDVRGANGRLIGSKKVQIRL
jgi:Secretion system C-terminal sorting domain/HYR domain